MPGCSIFAPGIIETTLTLYSPMQESPRIIRVEAVPLNVPLLADFTISSSKLKTVGNVAVRMELDGGGRLGRSFDLVATDT